MTAISPLSGTKSLLIAHLYDKAEFLFRLPICLINYICCSFATRLTGSILMTDEREAPDWCFALSPDL